MEEATAALDLKRQGLLEFLESHSDAALRMQSLDWVLDHLALLREQTQNCCAVFRVAEAELEATERRWRLASKHEDGAEAHACQATAIQQRAQVAWSEARWRRYETQYARLWGHLHRRDLRCLLSHYARVAIVSETLYRRPTCGIVSIVAA